MGRPQRRWTLLVGLAVLATSARGCTGGHDAAGSVTPVHLKNFAIQVAPEAHPGAIRLSISSSGPTMHELIVVRTALDQGRLPVADDGTVEEGDAGVIAAVGEAEGIDIGDHRNLDLRLQPGHYVLFCNMEGHYEAGMHASLTVSA